MKIVALIQARMGSSRLPGKVLLTLGSTPLLQRVVDAARAATGISAVVVATGITPDNDPIEAYCKTQGIDVFRGPEEDVLRRMAEAAQAYSADAIVRLTADCPLHDPAIISQAIALFRLSGCDYVSNVSPPSWPDGLDCEIVGIDALLSADRETVRPSDREHVTPAIRNNHVRFTSANLPCPIPGLHSLRWTCDTQDDLEHIEQLIAHLGHPGPYAWTDLLLAEEALAAARPVTRVPGASEYRNAGLDLSLLKESGDRSNIAPRRYDMSLRMLEQAEAVIPLASQTFSKSKLQFPVGAAPLFLTHGDGSRVWDVDGNEFLDLVNGLLCVVLGYRDPDVDAAIRQQLESGISFSLPTPLETVLAEKLTGIIPCAEMVRFGKNGSDATSAAVRIARAATGRDRIIACGYHGWHDWYIGSTTRNAGVPGIIRDLTHTMPYNNLDAAQKLFADFPGQIAAIIMEPANLESPAPGYLESLRDLAHRNGALLVFDEIITGFRFHLGGAQTLFGVTPDLACFGKSMANGMPISAITGSEKLMRQFDDIFVSGTFGGEALSLAASIATIEKMQREPVLDSLWRSGALLAEQVSRLIRENGLEDWMVMKGFDPWRLLTIKDHPAASAMAIKTMYIYEMARDGILTIGSHNVSYALRDSDIVQIVRAYARVLPLISERLKRGTLVEQLEVPSLQPVFRVR
jgi:glutamate-1-semialdehyde 2,1-aminomutase